MSHLNPRTTCLIAGIALLALTGPAFAEEIDCASAATTVEMNFCADKEYQAADKALNAAYDAALKSVRLRNMEKPYDANSFEDALRGAQRAWVAFRDADCKDVVAQVWTNGTGATSAILQCMTGHTLQRTKDLKEEFENK
jgi:uncharacterized protein YecT (DUF1311 family)